MKMRLENPDVETSLKMLEQGQSAVTAAKAGGYKTVSGMRSAIRAYERKKQLAQNPEADTQKSEAPAPVETHPSEMDKNRSGGGSVIFPNPFSNPEKNKYLEEATKKAVQKARTEVAEFFQTKAESEIPQDKLGRAEEPEKNSRTEQEILEAGEPLRTLETTNFRLSHRRQSNSLRITVRRKAGRYMQFDASDARELYAALGFMIDRYNLDKDDDFDQEERDA